MNFDSLAARARRQPRRDSQVHSRTACLRHGDPTSSAVTNSARSGELVTSSTVDMSTHRGYGPRMGFTFRKKLSSPAVYGSTFPAKASAYQAGPAARATAPVVARGSRCRAPGWAGGGNGPANRAQPPYICARRSRWASCCPMEARITISVIHVKPPDQTGVQLPQATCDPWLHTPESHPHDSAGQNFDVGRQDDPTGITDDAKN